MSFWPSLIVASLIAGAVIMFGLTLLVILMALDLRDPRAWWAARKYRRATQLPPATARQIKRSREANRAELDAIEMPRLSRGEIPRGRSDFGKERR